MTSPKNPWSRCSSTDREIIESLQGQVHPVKADDVLQQLRKRYRTMGDHVAVVDGARSWTYAELGQRVFGLARRLTDEFLPTVADRVFGVAINRSPELLVAVHSVALTGSAYCPIDPGDPGPWQSALEQASGATAVLVTDVGRNTHENAFAIGSERLARSDFELAAVGMRTASQVIFTSGSTGQPKGVVCTHGGFANRIRWMQETFPLQADDRVALKTPLTFDVAGWEMFWPQYAGASTVVIPPKAHTSPEALISIFNEHRVTVAHFVPSMLRMWLRAQGARRCTDLRMVFSSGEALDASLVEELARQSKAELHNLYGPTEAAIDVTHYPASTAPREPVPIGRPITNTALYVLDSDGCVCPVGEAGEIHIQGVGVASGYLGASEADEARFAPVPPAAPEGWGTFRTGDLGRYTADGQIEYMGRLDDQFKIRGQRVEPGEITQTLLAHEAVLDAHVRAHVSGTARTLLVAYVVIDAMHGMADLAGTLREHVAQRLPSRSIPSKFVFLDALPLSRHGKVDSKQLPSPGLTRPDLTSDFQEPSTPIEELIAGIWAHALDLDEVGVHDNFHELGGDSLAAVEISFVLSERLGLDFDDPLVPRILMDGDTVAHSAKIVAEAGIPL
ncbi:non-ribosomal peptide synthetase [Streptomyces sp. NPDC021056]|uniref:non-ribosomal peptide synthetase n=1 Tax=Streptomyces sp. NPDC021056 TaxID=3155012 RepID=UPI00340A1AA4